MIAQTVFKHHAQTMQIDALWASGSSGVVRTVCQCFKFLNGFVIAFSGLPHDVSELSQLCFRASWVLLSLGGGGRCRIALYQVIWCYLTPANALGMNVFLRCESEPNLPSMTQRRHGNGKLCVGVIWKRRKWRKLRACKFAWVFAQEAELPERASQLSSLC